MGPRSGDTAQRKTASRQPHEGFKILQNGTRCVEAALQTCNPHPDNVSQVHPRPSRNPRRQFQDRTRPPLSTNLPKPFLQTQVWGSVRAVLGEKAYVWVTAWLSKRAWTGPECSKNLGPPRRLPRTPEEFSETFHEVGLVVFTPAYFPRALKPKPC
jgi:hypothetical protein